MEKTINFTLRVWRQKDAHSKGYFEDHQMEGITGDTSFLEMLDILNERLVKEHKEPIVFDHDCREGICGMCSLYINGHPHGPEGGCTTCQVYMRKFNDGDVITIEPWRSAGFPVIKDLMVDRSAYDKIMQAGGYVSVNAGAAHHLHRMRGMRGSMQERLGDALRLSQSQPAGTPAARTPRSGTPRKGYDSQDAGTGLRQLHQHRRMRSRMPQVHLAEQHRTPQPRVYQSQARRLTSARHPPADISARRTQARQQCSPRPDRSRGASFSSPGQAQPAAQMQTKAKILETFA